MKKQLVECDDLVYLESELFNIKLQAPVNLQGRIEELINYVNEKIIQTDRNTKNEFKRVIYKRMKEAPTPEESKEWHDFYKRLDETFGND